MLSSSPASKNGPLTSNLAREPYSTNTSTEPYSTACIIYTAPTDASRFLAVSTSTTTRIPAGVVEGPDLLWDGETEEELAFPLPRWVLELLLELLLELGAVEGPGLSWDGETEEELAFPLSRWLLLLLLLELQMFFLGEVLDLVLREPALKVTFLRAGVVAARGGVATGSGASSSTTPEDTPFPLALGWTTMEEEEEEAVTLSSFVTVCRLTESSAD